MNDLQAHNVIGVDLGGTKILAGKVHRQMLGEKKRSSVPRNGSLESVMNALFQVIDPLIEHNVDAIGIGVPSVVDIEQGIVYDVQNIPSWKEVHLKERVETKYNVPVFLNNDANCFAIGEKYFGKGQGYEDFVALIIGTGIAAGIIINNKLYNGHNCGAGEFGMIPYLDQHYEYYSSGQFFTNVHDTAGEQVHQRAMAGDLVALKIFSEFGKHLGNALTAILYALDPATIILGGSVSKGYPFFREAMWSQIKKIAYRSIPDRLTIELSSEKDIAVLGAAALCYDPDAGYSEFEPEKTSR